MICFFLFFVFGFVWVEFFGGFRAKFLFFFGGGLFLFGVFFGGFKGQVRWPEGPHHLALIPPYLLFIFYLGGGLFLSFLFFALYTKKMFFPLRKGHFCLFLSISLCFSLAFFGLPLFQFLLLCLFMKGTTSKH